MAQYNADILLAVRGSEKAKREIEKLEASLDKLGKKASLDLSGQIRLKGAQSVLKERLKDQVAWNKEQKKSQQIARETSQELARQAQRAKGLNQFSNGGVFPKPDLEKEITKRNRIRAITRATAKIEASKTARLKGQNSLTNGLLKLNKATLEAARSEAQERGESVAKQRALNNELKKTQQYNKPIGPKQAPGKGAARRGGGGGGAGGGVAAGIGFPLLFGSGPGSIIGGAVGSAGGFGTQILASAIGGIIDQAIADVAKLGQAFTKTGVDADALANAIGDLSGSTKKLIEETKEVSGSQAAAEAAAKLMAAAIGEDAVGALVTLGDATNDLSSAAAILNTEFAALAAELLGPVAAGIAGLLERTNLINAAARFRKEGGVNADRIGAAGERGFKEGGQQGAIDAQAEEAGKIIIEQRREAAKLITDANIENSKTLEILAAEGQILDINKNLLDSKTLEITKGNIALKYAAKLEKEGVTPLEKKVIEQKKLNELKGIDNRVTEQQQAANRKAEADAKKAADEAEQARKKELQVRQALAQLDITAYNIAIETIQATEGNSAAIKEQLRNQDALLRKRIEIIKLSDKNRQIQELEIKIAKDQSFLEQVRLRNKQEELAVQKEITALKQAEETKNIERNLTRNIEDVERKIASPFGGDEAEQIDLLVEQQRRYTDITDQLKTAIAEQKKLELIDTSGAATNRREALEEQLSIYEKLLPQLNAVEQAELRRNQLMEKYGFIADEAATAMSSAVQSIITGTGSVEEAFSNMFANIGKAFIDMATQMLAQKAIMSLLEALFPGGPSLGGGGDGAFNIGKALTGRATGGPVNANQPYIVGERGPELMIPSSQGRIISNENLRSEMDRSAATRSAMARNPGAGVIDVRYSVERINNVDYVTASEFQQGMAQAAKQGAVQGEQRAMRTLKNSASTRRSVGF